MTEVTIYSLLPCHSLLIPGVIVSPCQSATAEMGGQGAKSNATKEEEEDPLEAFPVASQDTNAPIFSIVYHTQ